MRFRETITVQRHKIHMFNRLNRLWAEKVWSLTSLTNPLAASIIDFKIGKLLSKYGGGQLLLEMLEHCSQSKSDACVFLMP